MCCYLKYKGKKWYSFNKHLRRKIISLNKITIFKNNRTKEKGETVSIRGENNEGKNSKRRESGARTTPCNAYMIACHFILFFYNQYVFFQVYYSLRLCICIIISCILKINHLKYT